MSKQTEMTSKTARIEQRAWIGIVATDAAAQPPYPLSAGLKLQQFGKTPAKHCNFRATIETSKDESHVVFDFKGEATNDAEIGTILPNAIMNLRISEPGAKTAQGFELKSLTKDRLGAIDRGDVQFFVHGKLTYDDVFSVHHWVEVCFVFVPNPALRVSKDMQFENCQSHNEIDDNLE